MKADLPPDALLQRYATGWQKPGPRPYTDCFEQVVGGHVDLAAFVEAFYTAWLFKLERRILSRFLRRPSTDGEAGAVARGERQTFSAWEVEQRAETQLLVSDLAGRTRSWFMATDDATDPPATRLRFGSAVLPQDKPGAGLGLTFHLLLGFHKLYSRALLALACRRLRRAGQA